MGGCHLGLTFVDGPRIEESGARFGCGSVGGRSPGLHSGLAEDAAALSLHDCLGAGARHHAGAAQAVCFSEVRWPIHQGHANRFEPLGDEFLHDAALVHAGEAEVEAGVPVGEALVIKTEEL